MYIGNFCTAEVYKFGKSLRNININARSSEKSGRPRYALGDVRQILIYGDSFSFTIITPRNFALVLPLNVTSEYY